MTPPQHIVVKSFLLMDRWLSNIEADHSGRTLAQKVLTDKPSDAVDACFVDPGAPEYGLPSTGQPIEITDMSRCATLYPHYGDTRTAAGGPLTDDIIQCQLKPLSRGLTKSRLRRRVGPASPGIPERSARLQKRELVSRRQTPWMMFAKRSRRRTAGPARNRFCSPATAHRDDALNFGRRRPLLQYAEE